MLPVFTNCPVSTALVLMMPAWGGRTSARRRFWSAMSQAALDESASAVEALRLLLRSVQLFRGHELLAGQLLAALQVGFGPARVGQLLLVGGFGLLGLEAIALGVDAQEDGLGTHTQALRRSRPR